MTGYESSDSAVAAVSAGGLITAVAPGTATVVVRSTSGAQTLCRVNVSGGLPASIGFTASDATVAAGRSVPLPGVKGKNIDAAGLAAATYASTDESVVTVSWSDADAHWKLNGVNPGASGRIYAPHAGFCLETQFAPDSINHPEFIDSVLRAVGGA